MSRVVVIDDYEPTLRMYAAAIEKMLGGEVVPFSDPREALHYLNGMEPTLCVVDYSMPDMDGVEFVLELRGVPGRERTPIIMLTGKDDKELKNRALGAGVNVFLNKPVTADEFASHVRRLATQQTVQNDREGELRELKDRAEGAGGHPGSVDAIWIEGQGIGCSVADVQLLREAAHVYDVGKLCVAEKTLGTTALLSPASRAAIEKHAEAGAEILSIADSRLFNAAATMARSHHERWDGMGYPRKLKGDAIPLSGRIIAVADALVAMMNARPDRPAMTFGHALDQVKRESGTHFDPAIVEALDRIKDKIGQLRS